MKNEIPADLYTAEASESEQRTQSDLNVPDPNDEGALAKILEKCKTNTTKN